MAKDADKLAEKIAKKMEKLVANVTKTEERIAKLSGTPGNEAEVERLREKLVDLNAKIDALDDDPA